MDEKKEMMALRPDNRNALDIRKLQCPFFLNYLFNKSALTKTNKTSNQNNTKESVL